MHIETEVDIMATLQDKIDEVTSNSKYIYHVTKYDSNNEGMCVVTIDYWLQQGSSDSVNQFTKKYVVMNMTKENEIAYEDNAPFEASIKRVVKW